MPCWAAHLRICSISSPYAVMLFCMYLCTSGMFSLKLPDQRKLGYPGIQTSEKAIRAAQLALASVMSLIDFSIAASLSNQHGSDWQTAAFH